MDTGRIAIGIYDSGVGGLPYLAGIGAALPQSSIFYLADTANFPLGELAPETIVRRVADACQKFIAEHELDILVLACNTATTWALADLRIAVAIPVIGVVPAIRPAAQASQCGVIALLGTNATVRSPYLDGLVAENAGSVQVLRYATPDLVRLAEAKLAGVVPMIPQVSAALAPMLSSLAGAAILPDVIVLGCTHFSHLHSEIAAALPWQATLLDSVDAVVKRTVSIAHMVSSTSLHEARRPTRGGMPVRLFFETAETVAPHRFS